MLVLSRKTNESVVVFTSDGEFRITVVDNKRGDKVKLGFEASPKIRILREEIRHGPKPTAVDEHT